LLYNLKLKEMAKKGRKVEIPQPAFDPKTGAPLEAQTREQVAENTRVEVAPVQEEDKTLLLSADAITLSAMRTLQNKVKSGKVTLHDRVAEETLGQFQEDFWKQVNDLPWDLISLEFDPFQVVWAETHGSRKPTLHFEFKAPIEYAILSVTEMIDSLLVYHKHRQWVINNHSWVAKNPEVICDLLTRLKCILEQLVTGGTQGDVQ
jgi:hypothetical protein